MSAAQSQSSRGPRPPRLAEAVLARSLPMHRRDEVLGDMAESYARRAQGDGVVGARLWYWRHAFGIPGRLAWRRVKGSMSVSELRHAARSLSQSPGFVAVAVLSLGLGIGANTAIFSIVRSVLFTPLAVDHPEELRLVYYERPRVRDVSQYSSSQDEDPVTGARINSNYSYPAYERMRAAVEPGVELLGFNFVPSVAVVVDGQPALSASGMLASGEFFSVLRPQFAAGRPFDVSDDRPDAPPVVVVTYSFWQRAFGGDPAAVGSIVRINGAPFEIVGVTGPGFDGLSPGGFFAPSDVIAPFADQEAFAPRWRSSTGSMRTSDHIFWVRLIARLPEGVAAAPLEEAMTGPLRQTMVSTSVIDPEEADQVKVHFIDGSRGLDSLRQEVRKPLALLAGVVAAVLLIACVNLASLMLARGSARQHEIAVRRALGAGRLRLVRQLLLESLLLAAAGGVLGLALAIWAGPALSAALTASIGRVAVRSQLDGKLLVVVASVSLLAAVLSGVLPALRLTRRGAHDSLRTRSFSDGGARFTLGRVLITAQIAASIPLIVGAGLFLRTLGNLGAVDLGFNPDNLVMFRIDTRTVTEDRERGVAILEQVRRDLEELPGVSGVTLIENALMMGWLSNTRVTIDGERQGMYMNAVGPRFFDIMGMTLRAGRTLLPTDDADAPRVAVVNETAQRELFGGNAVGRNFILGDDEQVEVVGVVADAHYESVRSEVTPTFYDPYAQRGLTSAFVLVRTATPAARLERSILDVVSRADPGLPVNSLASQIEQIAASTGRERVFARLLALFGGFALLVASIGLYGVTAFAVAQRRPELGVRLALGAQPHQILWLVLRSVLILAAIGLAVGLVAARLISPVVDSMVYGIEPTDTSTLVGAALVMLAVAAFAGWLPALRAARTDALVVLSRD